MTGSGRPVIWVISAVNMKEEGGEEREREEGEKERGEGVTREWCDRIRKTCNRGY